jgi:ferredoxin
MPNNEPVFYAFLNQNDDDAWQQVINTLTPSIHPVDQAATRIWFGFFPLKLHRTLAHSDNPELTARKLLLEGKYRLADQVDTSAAFLYGHQYWSDVKREVLEYAADASAAASLNLTDQIKDVAGRLATRLKTDPSLLIGIVAVGFMTFQQIGVELFSIPAPAPRSQWNEKPDEIIRRRARNDGPGLFAFLDPSARRYTVTFREHQPDSTFRAVKGQDLTMAAATDRRDYRSADSRCIDGPIPIECRSGSCGSCWVGILSDPRRLSEPGEREIKKVAECGYGGFTPDATSITRLACQTRVHGNVTIVIPPWNGIIGRL